MILNKSPYYELNLKDQILIQIKLLRYITMLLNLSSIYKVKIILKTKYI